MKKIVRYNGETKSYYGCTNPTQFEVITCNSVYYIQVGE